MKSPLYDHATIRGRRSELLEVQAAEKRLESANAEVASIQQAIERHPSQQLSSLLTSALVTAADALAALNKARSVVASRLIQ